MKKIIYTRESTGPLVAKPLAGRSEWFAKIDKLGGDFEAYQFRGTPDAEKKRRRDSFYQGAWELAQDYASKLLRDWDWKGDANQDGSDITGAFIEGLLKQELKEQGLFGPIRRNPSDLRGYLSNTIRKGVFQQAGDFSLKRRNWLRFEENAVLAAADARKADWLPLVLRLTAAIGQTRKQQTKLPASAIGTTPLEFVLQLALNQKVVGGEVKHFLGLGHVKRTRQRREKDFREKLRGNIEM